MKTRPVAVLVLVQLVFAGALVAVAWSGMHGRAMLRRDLISTQAELARTRAALVVAQAAASAADRRAMTATARADRLQARVDALEAALRRQGVDPGSVVIQTTRQSPPAAASASPSPRSSSSPRPTPPSPSPSPTASPSPCTIRSPIDGRCVLR